LFISIDAANVTLNGSDISQYDAIDGTSYAFAQATPANQPAHLATGWGGSLPTGQFDGVSEYVHNNSITDVAGDDVAFYVITACQLVTAATWKRVWEAGYSGGSYPSHTGLIPGTLFWGVRRSDDAGSNQTQASTAGADTNRHIVEWVFKGTTHDLYVDGTQYMTDGTLNLGVANNLDRWALGSKLGASPSGYANINYSKYAAWTPVPSAAQRASILAFFQAAYPVS
jgi:hypothetical protein